MTATLNADGVIYDWPKLTLDADKVWDEVEDALDEVKLELPETPRRPDLRMVLDNKTGQDLTFMNPANYSSGVEELIPGTGDQTAAMVMLQGNTLDEQYDSARQLYEMFNLGEEGLSPAFIAALEEGTISHLVKQAYGKTKFEDQADRLASLSWEDEYDQVEKIEPVVGAAAAYGARPPQEEMVFEAEVPVYVQGTNTVPERAEVEGIYIAVSEDWETGKEVTRPIVPSIARQFYGAHFDEIPEVMVHESGHVMSIKLDEGHEIKLKPPGFLKAA